MADGSLQLVLVLVVSQVLVQDLVGDRQILVVADLCFNLGIREVSLLESVEVQDQHFWQVVYRYFPHKSRLSFAHLTLHSLDVLLFEVVFKEVPQLRRLVLREGQV